MHLQFIVLLLYAILLFIKYNRVLQLLMSETLDQTDETRNGIIEWPKGGNCLNSDLARFAIFFLI